MAEKKHNVLTFEAVQSAVLPEKWVPVPEYGKGMEVHVRGLTPEQIAQLAEESGENPDIHQTCFTMAYAVVEPEFTPAQWADARKKAARPFLRVLREAQEMSGMTEDAWEEAQGN